MQLRLTYAGQLLTASGSNTRVPYKRALRLGFHKQLKRFWQVHPMLSKIGLRDARQVNRYHAIIPFLESQFERHGYKYVPLVSRFLG